MMKSNIAKIYLGSTDYQQFEGLLLVPNAAITGGVHTRNKKTNETKVQVDNILFGKKISLFCLKSERIIGF